MESEPIQPRITIQNMSGLHWRIEMEHRFNNNEIVAFTVLLPKTDLSLQDVRDAAMLRLRTLLNVLLDRA